MDRLPAVVGEDAEPGGRLPPVGAPGTRGRSAARPGLCGSYGDLPARSASYAWDTTATRSETPSRGASTQHDRVRATAPEAPESLRDLCRAAR